MSQCTCTKDAQMTCIVHPTESSLKARIAELEEQLDKADTIILEELTKVQADNRRLRDANERLVSEIENSIRAVTKALLGGGE